MKKLSINQILSNEQYNKIRPEFRKRIFEIKEPRRIMVGKYLTFLFENMDTMHYQVQEMMRVEKITKTEAIQHEIETYNLLVPNPNELSASLLIEIVDPVERSVKLKELVGLQEHIFLLIDKDHQIQAIFDDTQIEENKISSVQYIRFELGEKAAQALRETESVEILATHPACSYRQSLTPQQVMAFKEDLS